MDVIEVPLEIHLILNQVFPESALPDPVLALANP